MRSATERFVDLFARKYTPAVIALALLLAVVPPLVAWSPLPDAIAAWSRAVSPVDWLHRGLVLLVIACPCALVISTPVTIVCGLNAAARRGVLIKGGQHLESAGQVQCVAFDKTGTLTTGRATVVEVTSTEAFDRAEVLRLASSLEVHSEHPLATAIVAAAKAEGIAPTAVDGFAALRGFGIEGQVAGRNVVCGNERLLERAGYPRGQIDPFMAQLSARYPTAVRVLVGADGALVGAISLADPPREDAAEVVSQLRASRIEQVTMLSGDSQPVAEFVAHSIGIDDARGGLLPEDKVKEVSRLAARYPRLAMVGDGVNDAPALAAARLGIAFGAGASDTALETADVVVMNDKLGRIAELLSLGRKTRQRLGENIAASLSIKAIVLLLAALGLATMWMAVAADVGASLLGIANGMRLLKHGTAESLPT
jgi:Cd2+/Zn2+-exporting ATPase